MLSVVTVNVNGVRATLKRGGLDWLREANARGDADIICFQEVRATTDELMAALTEAGMGHFNVVHSGSARKGHAGVAIVSALPFSSTKIGLGPVQFAEQGRWVQADIKTELGDLTVASVYVHTGDHEIAERQTEKEDFLAAMTKHMKKVIKASAPNSHTLIVGDLNVGHTENDIKNWKGNRGKSGFLESERVHFDEWFNKIGWVDLGRAHAGDIPGPYTWWSWRGQAFDNDAGWRIDYLVASPHLATHLKDVTVGRAETYAQRWSDHAPVTARFEIG
jgi:exodeoxyribonuclease-3